MSAESKKLETLTIIVHWREREGEVEIFDNKSVRALRNAIHAIFSATINCDADKLIVQTKDADNNPRLLDNGKLTLAEALCKSKSNSKGEYDVYVEVLPSQKEEVAGSARETIRARLWIGSDLSIRQIECKSFEQVRGDIIEEFQLFWSPSVELYFIPGNEPQKAILNKIKIQDDTTLQEYLKHPRPRPPILIFHGKSHTESPTQRPFSDSASSGSRSADSTRSDTDHQALFSQAVRDRDGCCLACGTDESLEAAHVYPWELRESLSKSLAAQELGHLFESSNGITLCHGCRYLFDQGYWTVKDGIFLVSASILGSNCKVAKVNGRKFPAFFRKQPVTPDTVLPGERRWPGPCTWAAREKEVYERESGRKRKEWQ